MPAKSRCTTHTLPHPNNQKILLRIIHDLHQSSPRTGCWEVHRSLRPSDNMGQSICGFHSLYRFGGSYFHILTRICAHTPRFCDYLRPESRCHYLVWMWKYYRRIICWCYGADNVDPFRVWEYCPNFHQICRSVTTTFYYLRIKIMSLGCVFTRIQARADELGWGCAPFGRRLLAPGVQCSQDLRLRTHNLRYFFAWFDGGLNIENVDVCCFFVNL